MGWFSPNEDCNCGCIDTCTGCLPFETVSITGASGATGARCPGGFPAYNGTHTLDPIVGVACSYTKRHSTVICGPNVELVNTSLQLLKHPDTTFPGLPAFPFSNGFRCIVSCGFSSNYGLAPYFFIFYKDFETCPSGSVSLDYGYTSVGTMPITATQPSDVTVTWP